MRNKNGWIRILEVVIAIMIIVGVLLNVYSKQNAPSGQSDLISGVQIKILDQISSNDSLRQAVLNKNFVVLNNFVNKSLFDVGASSFNFDLSICDLNSACPLDSSFTAQTINKNIYAEEKIISSDLTVYSPKKVKLFLWQR